MVLAVIDTVLWIFLSGCKATLNLVLGAIWFVVAATGYVLRFVWVVVSLVLFDWLPTLFKGLYGGAVADVTGLLQTAMLCCC